jgi:hypothetical protein
MIFYPRMLEATLRNWGRRDNEVRRQDAAIVPDSKRYFMANHRVWRQVRAEKQVRFLGCLDGALLTG